MLGKTVLTVFCIYIAYAALVFLLQRHMIYPHYLVESPPDETGQVPGLEKHWLANDFGKTELWFIPSPQASPDTPAPVVIFAHGNGEIIPFWPDELKVFLDLGIGIVLPEYPGYGNSQGSPSQASITAVYIKAYDMIARRPDVDPGRIVFFGRSLGGGVVCALARERASAAMILMSTFISIRAFAPRYLVPPFMVRDPYDNLALVSSYSRSIFIIHGRNDGVIPYSHGQMLAEAAPDATFLSYNGGHNDFPPGFEFPQQVAAFLKKAGILQQAAIPSNARLRAGPRSASGSNGAH